MNHKIKRIAKLITEDPDIFNEGWEDLGIQDPGFDHSLEDVKLIMKWHGFDLEGDYDKPIDQIDIKEVINDVLTDTPGISSLKKYRIINYDFTPPPPEDPYNGIISAEIVVDLREYMIQLIQYGLSFKQVLDELKEYKISPKMFYEAKNWLIQNFESIQIPRFGEEGSMDQWPAPRITQDDLDYDSME